MSDSGAIAAVTATLTSLLTSRIQGLDDGNLGSFDVKAMPPKAARPSSQDAKNRLNLVLYQVAPNPALRNQPPGAQGRSGEMGAVPLALNLFYLVTAFGPEDDDLVAHRLLGHAMRVLHDATLLDPAEIRLAAPESQLGWQVERVRITHQPLSVDELSKLWTMLQADHRPSVAYQVSVVLIDSKQPVHSPLPVLTRGVAALGTVLPPFPVLTGLSTPYPLGGAQLGDLVTLEGSFLTGAAAVTLTHLQTGAQISLAPGPGANAKQIPIQIPAGLPVGWGPGWYGLALIFDPGTGAERRSNTLTLPLLPQITVPNTADLDVQGNVFYTLTCEPPVGSEQQVWLLLGDRMVPAELHPGVTSTLSFVIANAPVGTHFVRLRVDGVESALVVNGPGGAVFDPARQVVIA